MERPLVQPGQGFVLPERLVLSQELARASASTRLEGPSTSQASAKKGEPWTEAEHRAFLQGLAALGKGSWKQISRCYVPTRTPTQVASHAQKHFLRVAGLGKRRSRFVTGEDEGAQNHSGTTTSGSPGPPQPRPHLAPGPPPASAVGPWLAAGAAHSPSPPAPGGFAVGIPVGRAPWGLPPPLHQPAVDLPILPVGPLLAEGIAQGTVVSPSSSRDSRGTVPHATASSGSSHHEHSSQQEQRRQQKQRAPGGGWPASGSVLRVPRPLPAPTSRQQQLFRLLEMREQQQQQQSATSSHGTGQPYTPPLARPPSNLPFRPAPGAAAAAPGAQPWAGAPAAAHSAQGSPIKQELQEHSAQLGPALWAAPGAPGGLAMLAAAAACSGDARAAGPGGLGAVKQEMEADSDGNSDADTTVSHSAERPARV